MRRCMFIPLRGKLLVENIPDTKMTESGLYIAQTVKEVPHRGRVISKGLPFMDTKGREHGWDVSIEEIVHFKRNWTGNTQQYILLKRDDVFAVEGNSGIVWAVRDIVIVKRVYTGKIGNSTIIIPETYGVESNLEDFYGEVMSVGKDDKMGIDPGDKILYHRNEGLEVKLPNGEIYFSLKPRAILAKI